MTVRQNPMDSDQGRDDRSRSVQIGFALLAGALIGVIASLLSSAGGTSMPFAVLAGGGAGAGAVALTLDLIREGFRDPVTAGFALFGGVLVGFAAVLLTVAGGVPLALAMLTGGGAAGGGIALALTIIRLARRA